jgi:hypothetical protein
MFRIFRLLLRAGVKIRKSFSGHSGPEVRNGFRNDFRTVCMVILGEDKDVLLRTRDRRRCLPSYENQWNHPQ